MKIKIIAVGKIKEKYLNMGIQEYFKRLLPYTKLEIIEIADEKAPENLSENQIIQVKKIEGDKILSRITPDDYVVALAIKGIQKSSEKLSIFFENHMTYNSSDIVFVIGGSNGLSDEVLTRSNELMSFSILTFPHQIMRLLLLEQIYRAYKILKNEPYHK